MRTERYFARLLMITKLRHCVRAVLAKCYHIHCQNAQKKEAIIVFHFFRILANYKKNC